MKIYETLPALATATRTEVYNVPRDPGFESHAGTWVLRMLRLYRRLRR
eukprot:COSAG02_NODE_50314_length_321_cov_0.797297_1_plen_47_part_10